MRMISDNDTNDENDAWQTAREGGYDIGTKQEGSGTSSTGRQE